MSSGSINSQKLQDSALKRKHNSQGMEPIHTERRMKVICAGAGAGGLLFAYKMQRDFNNFDLTVYEKNSELSGTWFENRYPGCACDIPAHNYTWSFEPNPNWSTVYVGSEEIYRYFNNFADKYSLRKYCKTEHQVTGAYWNDSQGNWRVAIKNPKGVTFHDTCDLFINACGILNAWKWPDIPGLERFKGTLLHSARWDQSVDLSGKRVGLIGNGSSAIQILPAIQPQVKRLTTFIRGATWLTAVFGEEQHRFTDEEKKKFATDHQSLLKFRKVGESSMNGIFQLFLRDSPTQKEASAATAESMRKRLNNPELAEKLIPKWPVGGRRITPGEGYLEALTADNVEIVQSDITEVTPSGVKTGNGMEYPLDILICATGFDVSYKPRFPVVGNSGKNLQDLWSNEPKSYLGIAAPQMPNYFGILGPNSPVGNGPVLIAMEYQINYILQLCDRWQTENIHSMTPKDEAIDDFIEWKDKFMERTVWTDTRYRSWYKHGTKDGKVSALWPGSTLHYLEALHKIRYEDWNIVYDGNRFSWLGNGLSQTESDETADKSYYIRNHDDSEPLNTKKRLKILNKAGTEKSHDNVSSSGILAFSRL